MFRHVPLSSLVGEPCILGMVVGSGHEDLEAPVTGAPVEPDAEPRAQQQGDQVGEEQGGHAAPTVRLKDAKLNKKRLRI